MTSTIEKWLQNLKLFGFCLSLVGSGISISMCSIGCGLYIGSFITSLLLIKNEIRRVPAFPKFIYLTVLLCSLLASLFVSPYFFVSLRGLGKYLGGFILFYAGFELGRNDRQLCWIIRVLLLVYFIAALAGVVQDVFGFDLIYFRPAIHSENYTRVTGPFKNFNDYASFLAPIFPIAIVLWIQRDKKRLGAFTFLTLLIFLSSYALYRTLSRGAMVAVLISLFVLISFFKFRKAAYGGLAVLTGLLWFAPLQMSLRFRELLHASLSSTHERFLLIDTAISMIKASPVFGLGLNTYSINFPMYKPRDYTGLMYAHNSYLQMGSEIGLLGISLYLLFLFALLAHLVNTLRGARKDSGDALLCAGFVAGVGGLLVNGLFESLLQSTQLRTLFWSLLGVAFALAYRAKFSKREQLS
ncbi:MAG: hypothetical protein A3C47_01235 [Omnitrophica bacterium RIFCSPHIGHO2_02_FULL_51_18]|nr:MAG: hypothetical protein A3C47_01235 [Omnitrophica bacterium RIFCSPHIGHO2_02_FULL_51_18]